MPREEESLRDYWLKKGMNGPLIFQDRPMRDRQVPRTPREVAGSRYKDPPEPSVGSQFPHWARRG